MKDKALRMALEAFEWNYNTDLDNIPACEKWAKMLKENIAAIKEALAQSDQESDDLTIAYMSGFHDGKNKNAPQPKPEQEPVAYKGKGIVSPASVLEMTRNAFGLNVSDLADVFQTTRQTVYQWMKLSDMEQVRSHAHLERIKVVYRATQFWNEQPILKGRWSKAILPTGGTVLDILKANEIDLDTLKAAHASLSGSLAQPEQEPVAWRTFDGEGNYDFLEYEANESYRDEYIKCNGTKYASWVDPLYTAPPQRTWVGLTEEEIDIWNIVAPSRLRDFVRAIEAKLKEKNGG